MLQQSFLAQQSSTNCPEQISPLLAISCCISLPSHPTVQSQHSSAPTACNYTATHMQQQQHTKPPCRFANNQDITHTRTYRECYRSHVVHVCMCPRSLPAPPLVKAMSTLMVSQRERKKRKGGMEESMSHLCRSPGPAAPWVFLSH